MRGKRKRAAILDKRRAKLLPPQPQPHPSLHKGAFEGCRAIKKGPPGPQADKVPRRKRREMRLGRRAVRRISGERSQDWKGGVFL